MSELHFKGRASQVTVSTQVLESPRISADDIARFCGVNREQDSNSRVNLIFAIKPSIAVWTASSLSLPQSALKSRLHALHSAEGVVERIVDQLRLNPEAGRGIAVDRHSHQGCGALLIAAA